MRAGEVCGGFVALRDLSTEELEVLAVAFATIRFEIEFGLRQPNAIVAAPYLNEKAPA